MRTFIFLLSLLFSVASIYAENATNVRVRQEGQTIVVTYDLTESSPVKLLMSIDNSTDLKELNAVKGDVGDGIPAGKNRTIVWSPLEEYNGFAADNVCFIVECPTSDGQQAGWCCPSSRRWSGCRWPSF